MRLCHRQDGGARRALAAGLAAIVWGVVSCSSGPRPAPGGETAEPLPPAPEPVGSLPTWVAYPHLHPERRASEVIGAAGRSAHGPIDAENDALDALVETLLIRVQAAHRRAAPLHDYFAYDAEFADVVHRRLEPSSPFMTAVLAGAAIDSASRIVHHETHYAFAYLDRAATSAMLERRGERQARRVEEAVDIAMNAAELDNWFGFVRWSRAALVREAERVALLVLRDAVGGAVPLDAFERTHRLRWVGIAADTLQATHGWTLHTEFEWVEPPPRQMEARIDRHIMAVLLGHGLKVGFGEGCPKRTPRRAQADWPVPEPVADEEPDDHTDDAPTGDEGGEPGPSDAADTADAAGDDTEEEEEEPEPRPHHVLEIRGRGNVTRTALASWDAVVELTIETRTCGMGPMATQRSLATLEGRGGRDAQSAYLKALDWEALGADLVPRLHGIDLIPPIELVGDPPEALGAF